MRQEGPLASHPTLAMPVRNPVSKSKVVGSWEVTSGFHIPVHASRWPHICNHRNIHTEVYMYTHTRTKKLNHHHKTTHRFFSQYNLLFFSATSAPSCKRLSVCIRRLDTTYFCGLCAHCLWCSTPFPCLLTGLPWLAAFVTSCVPHTTECTNTFPFYITWEPDHLVSHDLKVNKIFHHAFYLEHQINVDLGLIFFLLSLVLKLVFYLEAHSYLVWKWLVTTLKVSEQSPSVPICEANVGITVCALPAALGTSVFC